MTGCILWDWDGVLADSLDLYLELYKTVSSHYRKKLPIVDRQGFRTWYEPRWEKNYIQMGFAPGELKEALGFAEQWLDYGKVKLFPGVPEMLRRLHGKLPMAICSTTPSTMIRARLADEGLEGMFDVYTGGEDGNSDKIEKIGQTLEKLRCRDGVMVGDTFLDIECARHHGLTTVGVTYGWISPERVLAARPDHVVDDPRQLEDKIREVVGV